jgi:uncharacterized protein (DUF302 family)
MQPLASTTFSVNHLRIETTRAYDDVTKSFVGQLGSLDQAALHELFASRPDPEQLRARLEEMGGSSGLTLFATIDHGAVSAVLGGPRRVVEYMIGNPLIAQRMTQHEPGAGLYAPLRVLIHEEEGRTVVEYDQPSSLLGQFGSESVDEVGRELDSKMMDLLVTSVVTN